MLSKRHVYVDNRNDADNLIMPDRTRIMLLNSFVGRPIHHYWSLIYTKKEKKNGKSRQIECNAHWKLHLAYHIMAGHDSTSTNMARNIQETLDNLPRDSNSHAFYSICKVDIFPHNLRFYFHNEHSGECPTRVRWTYLPVNAIQCFSTT